MVMRLSSPRLTDEPYLFLEDRFKSRIKFFPDVFQQTWFAKANSVLQAAQEILIRHLYHVQAVVFLLDAFHVIFVTYL